MRHAASLVAVALAGLLWLQVSAQSRADEPGPFPSPSPSIVPAAGNGYVAVTFGTASSDGGQVPPSPGSTATPAPFANATARVFSLDLLGRISDSYLAGLKFDGYAIHGNDNPYVSYSQGSVLYNVRATNLALGLGYLSLQRSSSSVSLNGGGLGVELLPRFRSGSSVYGSAFFYPHLTSNGTTASVTSLEAGILFSPPRRGGFFYRAGAFLKNVGGSKFSPQQISGLNVGVGASF